MQKQITLRKSEILAIYAKLNLAFNTYSRPIKKPKTKMSNDKNE